VHAKLPVTETDRENIQVAGVPHDLGLLANSRCRIPRGMMAPKMYISRPTDVATVIEEAAKAIAMQP
jgi:hypothetical protein